MVPQSCSDHAPPARRRSDPVPLRMGPIIIEVTYQQWELLSNASKHRRDAYVKSECTWKCTAYLTDSNHMARVARMQMIRQSKKRRGAFLPVRVYVFSCSKTVLTLLNRLFLTYLKSHTVTITPCKVSFRPKAHTKRWKWVQTTVARSITHTLSTADKVLFPFFWRVNYPPSVNDGTALSAHIHLPECAATRRLECAPLWCRCAAKAWVATGTLASTRARTSQCFENTNVPFVQKQ